MKRHTALLLLLSASLCVAGCGDNSTKTAVASPAQTGEADLKMAPSQEKPSKPKRIAMGERVDIAAHAAKGQTTVFDFTSEYCGPCRQIAPYVDKLHQARADIEVVKVDINRPGKRGIDWQSPVAQQYGISSVPHMKIYSPEGELVAEGQPAWQMIAGWITEILQAEQQAAG